MYGLLLPSSRQPAPLRGLALLLLLGCAEQNVTPGTPPAPSSLCVYPRACYLADCDDCSGGPSRCRRVLGGCGADMGPVAGCTEPPKPTDPGVLCPLPGDGGPPMVCALPEQVCVARGVPCEGSCVRAGQGCESGMRLPPQHASGDGGAGTFCPYTDDVCCPAPDGGAEDMRAPEPMDAAGQDAASQG